MAEEGGQGELLEHCWREGRGGCGRWASFSRGRSHRAAVAARDDRRAARARPAGARTLPGCCGGPDGPICRVPGPRRRAASAGQACGPQPSRSTHRPCTGHGDAGLGANGPATLETLAAAWPCSRARQMHHLHHMAGGAGRGHWSSAACTAAASGRSSPHLPCVCRARVGSSPARPWAAAVLASSVPPTLCHRPLATCNLTTLQEHVRPASPSFPHPKHRAPPSRLPPARPGDARAAPTWGLTSDL